MDFWVVRIVELLQHVSSSCIVHQLLCFGDRSIHACVGEQRKKNRKLRELIGRVKTKKQTKYKPFSGAVKTTLAPSAFNNTRRSNDIDAGIVSTSS
jgi:hypothetical protein